MTIIFNELPRKQLQFIVTKFSHSICDDPKLCEAMLMDLCAEQSRELNLLVVAIKEKVAVDLLNLTTEIPLEISFKKLSQRLYDKWGMAEHFADWAVESVALALNVIPQPFLSAQTIQTTEEETSLAPLEAVIELPVPLISLVPPSSILQQQIGKFIVQEGIATDTETELTWLRFAYGQTWQHDTAEGKVKKLSWQSIFEMVWDFNAAGGYGGFTDWRLPTLEELKTLLDKVRGKQGHCIDETVFPCDDASLFWASLQGSQGSQDAWVVNFSNGSDSASVEYNGYAVRLVRQNLGTA